ncbi:MAG: GTP-sensing pleiotropic transcriptional regulator CodY [Lachnospiraceae bacterium]|nr:GTP-sensing pleiotropic transcriptional regulator CodY [Lachnospiraceae bacterium]
MSVQLLDRTRKIGRLLHNASSSKVVFNDICSVLVETLSSNVLVLSRKGKVLGIGLSENVTPIRELLRNNVGERIDSLLNDRLLGILSTKENVNLATLGFELPGIERYYAIIMPIEIAGERLGTVFAYREDRTYSIEDIIVCEYGNTVVGLEMIRSVDEEYAESTRKKQVVTSAFATLSGSEIEAILHIFDELEGSEGILVASKIADRIGITRSVIVNALRKLESAGIIVSRSSGMKGTYIKVQNDYIFEELRAKRDSENLKSSLDKE